MEIVWVIGTGDDHRVVLFEQHPDHPDGEVYIVDNGRPVQSAMTAAVIEMIAAGRLAISDGRQEVTDPVGELSDRIDSLSETLGIHIARRLRENGFETIAAVREATDKELIALPGIGAKAVEKIREAMG